MCKDSVYLRLWAPVEGLWGHNQWLYVPAHQSEGCRATAYFAPEHCTCSGPQTESSTASYVCANRPLGAWSMNRLVFNVLVSGFLLSGSLSALLLYCMCYTLTVQFVQFKDWALHFTDDSVRSWGMFVWVLACLWFTHLWYRVMKYFGIFSAGSSVSSPGSYPYHLTSRVCPGRGLRTLQRDLLCILTVKLGLY